MPSPVDTIAALATPVGTSALAVVRASGPQAAALAQELAGSAPPPRTAVHTDYRDRQGVLVDDVLLTFFAGPNSYTGEDSLEVSCHGNPWIAQRILGDLLARGCRSAEPGEFTKRAFLHGRIDLSQAEAVMDLISARSERALEAANRQLRGSLGRKMAGLTGELVEIVARIEAYIDFPEEDLPAEDRQALVERVAALRRETTRLLATNQYGHLLRDGIKTLIVGRTNAGKSSLLNRLVGKDRAIVSPEPGTTRDYLEELVRVGPHALRLIDTAGLNPTPSELERRGIDKTVEQAAEADLVLWVMDATAPDFSVPAEISPHIVPGKTLIVLNKTDLNQDGGSISVPAGMDRVLVSALTGQGIDELVNRLVSKADSFRTDWGEDFIAINARHADALARALAALAAAAEKLANNGPSELIASELRAAMDAMGEISGRIDNERVLDALFSTFCIGK